MSKEKKPKAENKEKKIAVVEIFGPTFQGEGPLAGAKTMFVRFGGCDYRCKMCDSLHAVDPMAVKKHAKYLTAEEILDQLLAARGESGTCWVTLSGGNPCMWDLTRLVSLCNGAGLACAVETQGTLWQPWLASCQMVVLSPKAPGMGEKFEEGKLIAILQKIKESGKVVPVALKIVVFSMQDIEFALSVERIVSAERTVAGIISPGLLFLSLGNPYPPKLNEALDMVDDFPISRSCDLPGRPFDHVTALLREYRILMEDFVQDPRIQHWRFLPQLHVLTYSNEGAR